MAHPQVDSGWVWPSRLEISSSYGKEAGSAMVMFRSLGLQDGPGPHQVLQFPSRLPEATPASNKGEVNKGGGASFLCPSRVKPGRCLSHLGSWWFSETVRLVGRHCPLPTSTVWRSAQRPQDPVVFFHCVWRAGDTEKDVNSHLIISNFPFLKERKDKKNRKDTEFHPPVSHLVPVNTSSAPVTPPLISSS